MALSTFLDGLGFAESPRWHANRLWFSDMDRRWVFASDLANPPEEICFVSGRPSGLGWLPDGRMLVVSMDDRLLLRLDESGLTKVAELGSLATFHCNDMVVDRKGRAYVGNFGFDYASGAELVGTVLIRVDPDGTISSVADDLLFPNGMAISPDGKTLTVAESFGSRVSAYTVDPDGGLHHRRTFAKFAEVGDRSGSPDGMCLDAEGAAWVAVKNHVLRVREGGDVLEDIETQPGWNAVACMLGGADRRTLFVTTSTKHDAGRTARIETMYVDVPGAGLP